MGRQLIFIWGGAILLYLLVVHASGTTSILNSLSQFVNGTTKTLQGR